MDDYDLEQLASRQDDLAVGCEIPVEVLNGCEFFNYFTVWRLD